MEVITPVHMTYTPQVNDYVVWKDMEGWVYFTCDEYITIEVGTKPKHDGLSQHKKDHILVLCFTHDHHQLEYKGKRASKYDDTINPTL